MFGRRIPFLWCQTIREWLDASPRCIIFSDESRFCEGPDSIWVRFEVGDWNETALRCTAKFANGEMVWGAIGPNFKSDLSMCSDGVNSREYISIVCQSGMIEACDARHGQRQWFFQQDGAPARRTQEAIDTLSLFMQLLRRGPMAPWPANRCELNPIEMVWAIMGHAWRVASSVIVRGFSPPCWRCGMHCPWIQSTRLCSISRGASAQC
jgi:hypothetical protein